MKHISLLIFIIVVPFVIFSQQEYHVFPSDHKISPGSVEGNGTLNNPWDLQTALNQQPEKVNGGDVILLHAGIYNGRFISKLRSSNNKKITVTSFKNNHIILNGNIRSNQNSVLQIRGRMVIFKNFEITFLGDFSRDQKDENFQKVGGIDHVSGVNCEFINLKIHNNPGSGFGLWKRTGGSLIYGCTIFNNGYFSLKRGSGVGIYVQNESDQIRIIENNIIFNNYYKGIEVWSAARNAKTLYVKNVSLQDNVIFNNGLPSGRYRDNLIIATDDMNGINIAKNIKVIGNVFYHNTNFSENQVGGDAPSLTLGFNPKAPLQNIEISNNIIIGRNNALRFNNVGTLTFKNNITYTGYVHFNKSVLENIKKWKFEHNHYFTKRNVPFRITKHKDFTINQWKSELQIDRNSSWNHLRLFDLNDVLSITQNSEDRSLFKLVIFNKQGNDVTIDLSKFGFNEGQRYTIMNIADDTYISKGKINAGGKIVASIGTYNSTINNFGVFQIKVEPITGKKNRSFKRFFKWLF
jgi:hypothetical protein